MRRNRHQGNSLLFSYRCQLRELSPLNNLMYQIIDAVELSKRWSLPLSWVREYTRTRTKDTIPHLRLGHYVRFQWDSPELNQWLERHAVKSHSR